MTQDQKGFCFEAVSDRAEHLFDRFQIPLPGDFYQAGDGQFAIGKLQVGGLEKGMAVGCYKKSEKEFSILLFYVEKDVRSTNLVCYLIGELLSLAERLFLPERYIWKYEIRDPGKDPYQNLMNRVPGYCGTVHEICENHLVSTKDFPAFRHAESFYGVGTMEKKGFLLLRWKDCDESVWKQFEEMRKTADEELLELMPFVGEDYEERTSMVVVERATGKPASWMICREISPREVELRRWYTPEEFRVSRIGLIFGAYMLDVLGKHYELIRYQMKADNRSMKGFTSHYFGNAVTERSYRRYMEIKKL